MTLGYFSPPSERVLMCCDCEVEIAFWLPVYASEELQQLNEFLWANFDFEGRK